MVMFVVKVGVVKVGFLNVNSQSIFKNCISKNAICHHTVLMIEIDLERHFLTFPYRLMHSMIIALYSFRYCLHALFRLLYVRGQIKRELCTRLVSLRLPYIFRGVSPPSNVVCPV